MALYCGHSAPYSETWPTSGMTRSGAAYELPMWEHRTTGSGSSLLPTPRSTDGHGPGVHGQGGQDLRTTIALLPTPDAYSERGGPQHPDKRRAGGHSVTLQDVATNLLPTPRATDGAKGGPNQRGTGGDLMLPSAVHRLMPTPTAMDSRASGGSSPEHVTLTDAVVRTELGASTNPRSGDGNESSADPPPLPLWPDDEDNQS